MRILIAIREWLQGGAPTWCVIDDEGGGDADIAAIPRDLHAGEPILADNLRRHEAIREARRLNLERERSRT